MVSFGLVVDSIDSIIQFRPFLSILSSTTIDPASPYARTRARSFELRIHRVFSVLIPPAPPLRGLARMGGPGEVYSGWDMEIREEVAMVRPFLMPPSFSSFPFPFSHSLTCYFIDINVIHLCLQHRTCVAFYILIMFSSLSFFLPRPHSTLPFLFHYLFSSSSNPPLQLTLPFFPLSRTQPNFLSS